MQYAIVLFGGFMVLTGATILVRPKLFVDLITRHIGSLSLQVLAVVIRLVLGVVLILYADQSRFPLTLQVLGCIAVAAAVLGAILPRDTFQKLISWALDKFSGYMRVGGVGALVFGGFLIYAVMGT